MTIDENSKKAIRQETDVSRFGLFGDLPTRLMSLTLRWQGMPRVIEAALLYFFAFIVLILAHAQRRAILRNLKIIWPDFSWAEGYVGAYRVFINFGWTYIDGMRTRLGQKVVTWEIDGAEIFEQLRATPGAAIILTTHTGNYDLAAALFSARFGRDLHTVRAPERSPFLQEIRRQELERDTRRYKHFKVHYNSSQSLLGIELARLLLEGELVAIQSDRVIGEVAAVEVPLENRSAKIRLPRGPMMLATLAKCPIFPLHVVRAGYRHYRVIIREPLVATAQATGEPVREMDHARAWAGSLIRFLEEHGLQWLVFEEAFTA